MCCLRLGAPIWPAAAAASWPAKRANERTNERARERAPSSRAEPRLSRPTWGLSRAVAPEAARKIRITGRRTHRHTHTHNSNGWRWRWRWPLCSSGESASERTLAAARWPAGLLAPSLPPFLQALARPHKGGAREQGLSRMQATNAALADSPFPAAGGVHSRLPKSSQQASQLASGPERTWPPRRQRLASAG